jgi:integrase
VTINLTAKKVEQLRKVPGRYRDEQVKGLLLVVTGPNSAAWTLRYERDGKERWMGLGGLRDLPLAAARERAREKRLLLLDGKDPLDVKQSEKAARRAADLRAMTFKECAEAYLAQHSTKWRNAAHARQWTASLATYAYPLLGDLPVAAVDTPLVLRVLEQRVEADGRYPGGTLWEARRETANRTRGRIESILAWATVRQYRTGDNPAAWAKHLSEVLPNGVPQEHHAALPYATLPAFLSELRTSTAVAARALEFLILTAARSNEVLGAKWEEVDLDEGTWTVPATRMKSGREHRVPLSPAAIALLRSLYTQEGNSHVFIGGGGGALAQDAMRRVLLQMNREATVHGFRSAFRDWAGEQTAFPHDVAEAALAHSRGAVHAAYQRGDLLTKRRRLMEAWAGFCSTPAKATGDVVPIKKARAI